MEEVRGRFMNNNKVEVENVEVSVEYLGPEPPKPGFLRSLLNLFTGSPFRAWRGTCTVSETDGMVLFTFGANRLELADGRSGAVIIEHFDEETGQLKFVGKGWLT